MLLSGLKTRNIALESRGCFVIFAHELLFLLRLFWRCNMRRILENGRFHLILFWLILFISVTTIVRVNIYDTVNLFDWRPWWTISGNSRHNTGVFDSSWVSSVRLILSLIVISGLTLLCVLFLLLFLNNIHWERCKRRMWALRNHFHRWLTSLRHAFPFNYAHDFVEWRIDDAHPIFDIVDVL